MNYLISESFRGWKEHKTVVFPSFVTIFLCALLLGLSGAFLLSAYHLSSVEKRLYSIEVFLKNPVTPDSLEKIQSELFLIKQLDSVAYKSPDSAMAEFKKRYSDDMLSLVTGNPLPASFVLTLAPRYRTPDILHEVVLSLSRSPAFDAVESPTTFVDKISEWKFSFIFWPIAATILIFVTLFLIIGNAVRLSLFSRKLLVENMKYAGGSAMFIELPFVLEGVMQGILASGFAALLLGFAASSFVENVPVVAYYLDGYGAVLCFVVALVTLISAYSSYRSVRGFLHRENFED
ncbi:MAG: permease-like cell division protein FtsX [Fibrobacteraceae bacterium]|nr:permease-like cell division protein FtsX [Fibrobacteraceae bacterium]